MLFSWGYTDQEAGKHCVLHHKQPQMEEELKNPLANLLDDDNQETPEITTPDNSHQEKKQEEKPADKADDDKADDKKAKEEAAKAERIAAKEKRHAEQQE